MKYTIQIQEPGKAWEDTPKRTIDEDTMVSRGIASFATDLAKLFNTKIRVAKEGSSQGHYYENW